MSSPERHHGETPPSKEEVADSVDMDLAEVYVEAMKVEEWDLATVMHFMRVAYLKGGSKAASQIIDAVSGEKPDS